MCGVPDADVSLTGAANTVVPVAFALGISFWIFFQGFVNLGMALGMLPTKGLTFPLVSYGGSSIIIMSATS